LRDIADEHFVLQNTLWRRPYIDLSLRQRKEHVKIVLMRKKRNNVISHLNQPFVSFTGQVKVEDPNEVLPIEINGKDISDRLWELAGAFDGSTLTVKIQSRQTDYGKVDAIVLRVKHEYLERPMLREILSLQDGDLVFSHMHNVEFYLKKAYHKHGIGTYSLAVEARAAYEIGFTKIIANAANQPAAGWRVWPKLGYDAVVEPDILQKMQPDLAAAGLTYVAGELRISDLWDNGNYEFWERHGAGCIMEFDVSSTDSWSMKRIGEVISEMEK
jgi:GNAT superfamily N-acetyltransferase